MLTNMSERFQTCPGCQSLVLYDTAECPECGHKFRGAVSMPTTAGSHERGATVYQTCPKCGDDVPAGLVRCWTCNAFMREDVARKYQVLVDNPQKIIFSDVPPDERTETIPPRASVVGQGGYARVNADAGPEFVLAGEDDESEFQLDTGTESQPETPQAAQPLTSTPSQKIPSVKSEEEASQSEAPVADSGPEQAESSGKTEESIAEQDDAEEGTTEQDDAGDDALVKDSNDSSAESKAPGESDLLGIALIQEREALRRKRDRKASINRKRIMIPCPSCGAWMRVREEQSGRTVRCRKCKTAISVPKIKRKEAKPKADEGPKIQITWVDDVHMHLIVPTEIALKPGSLKDVFDSADIGFHADGLHFVRYASAAQKKSLFGRKSADDGVDDRRRENREHIEKTGALSDLPHGEVHTIPVENLTAVRLVQPVRKAHESMFAGVDVFGEGKIVVYLPLKLDEEKQAFCSMPLSAWRRFAHELKTQFEIELPAKENGVPQKDVHSSPACHYTQTRIESIRNVEYYENDPAFELELTGYRCVACAIAVSEAGRAANKLGGAKGKSIAKAKCPGCSAKFGNEPLYKITRQPDPIEEDEEPTAKESASAESPSAESPSEDSASAESPSAESPRAESSDES